MAVEDGFFAYHNDFHEVPAGKIFLGPGDDFGDEGFCGCKARFVDVDA